MQYVYDKQKGKYAEKLIANTQGCSILNIKHDRHKHESISLNTCHIYVPTIGIMPQTNNTQDMVHIATTKTKTNTLITH